MYENEKKMDCLCSMCCIIFSNISIYTNDKKLINNAKKYLNNSNIHVISDSYAKSHKGWSGHSYGYDMLNDLNVFSYLSA